MVLFLGTEPAMRWEEYCDVLLGVAQEFKVERIYYLGGVMDSSTPYTKEPNVSCIVSNPDLKEEMKRYAVLFANYEGPGSIGTTLLDVSAKRGIEYVSLIGRSLWYPEFNIGISQNPKVMGAILKRLRRLLGIDLDLSTVEKASQELEDKLNFMASQIPRFGDYVKKLEEDFEEIKYQEPIEIKGDEAVKAAEEFLKRKPEDNS